MVWAFFSTKAAVPVPTSSEEGDLRSVSSARSFTGSWGVSNGHLLNPACCTAVRSKLINKVNKQ